MKLCEIEEKNMKNRITFFRVGAALLLFAGVLGCKHADGIIDNVDNDKDNVGGGGEMQSIAFVPQSSDGKANLHYVEVNGLYVPMEMTLNFEVVPAEAADKLAASWQTSLILVATYTDPNAASVEGNVLNTEAKTISVEGDVSSAKTASGNDVSNAEAKTAAAGDEFSLPISNASASDGKLTLTASAKSIDNSFFKETLGAKVCLVASLDGISKSSDYVQMVPYADNKSKAKIDIPDINFKKYLVDNYDRDGDGEISFEEAGSVEKINISSSYYPIHSLSGIEYFTYVKSLECSGNKIESLDLKSNSSLKKVDVSNNPLSSINFGSATFMSMESLNVSGTGISELDLTGLTKLKSLYVSDTPGLTTVRCPSMLWMMLLNNLYDDFSKCYVDADDNFISGPVCEIDGIKWSNHNLGSTCSNLPGNDYSFADAQTACPDGWRLPTGSEFDLLRDNYSSIVVVNGCKGRWFSGSALYPLSIGPVTFLPKVTLDAYCSSTRDFGDTWLYLHNPCPVQQSVVQCVCVRGVPVMPICAVRCVQE